MNLSGACLNILTQLTSIVEQISAEDFSKPSTALSKSTVGQHLRHTLEFFICFMKGCETGVINYDKRAHDKLIETDKFIALNAIKKIGEFVDSLSSDTALKLEVGYDEQHETFITIATNTSRELVYNIEHAVHHMALMKIGIREVADYVKLPENFGIAASTVRFQDLGQKQSSSR